MMEMELETEMEMEMDLCATDTFMVRYWGLDPLHYPRRELERN